MKTPVAFVVYNRPWSTQKVFDVIKRSKPKTLYLISDGPKNESENLKCDETRKIVERDIDWECNLIKVYSDENLGCARRIQTGLDFVFKREEMAIILEDDTLPDPSFFNFCEELLIRFKDDPKVAQISGCNLFPEIFTSNKSYEFSSITNIWGWATWRANWQMFDLSMKGWNDENKAEFLKKWYVWQPNQKNIRKMFDLHCEKYDPWTWDYQWNYCCWKNDGLSIIPNVNLVSNIGIGPGATHTVSEDSVPFFPEKIDSIESPLRHPEKVERNISFEKNYRKLEQKPKLRLLKNYLKAIFTFLGNISK